MGLCTVFALALSALVAKLSHGSHPNEVAETPTQAVKEAVDNPITDQIRLRMRLPKLRLPEDALGLTFRVSHKDGDVFIRLNNHTDHPLNFYNSMKLETSMFPSGTRIEVRDKFGRPFVFRIEEHTSLDHWTPLYLTSRAFLNSELEVQTLEPGEGFCKTVPLKNFFGGANFDFKAQNFQARIRSRIYLDTNFQQYIETKSDWFELPKALEDIPPPADC